MCGPTDKEESERGAGNPDHLLNRIGGPQALEAAVEIFYERLVNDKSLQDFFENVDMDKLKLHQRKFLTLALTEVPQDVDVPKLIAEKHRRLFAIGLNASHFDKVAEHLVETLKGLQVHEKLINEIVAVIAPLRSVFETGEKKHLLDKIGGPQALEAAVEIFYERLVADQDLAVFFEGIDIDRLKEHQRKFLTLALTEVPKGVDVPKLISEKHSRLFEIGLNETHFDLVAKHLVESLQGLQVKDSHIGEIVAIIGPLRSVFEEGAKAQLSEEGEPSLVKDEGEEKHQVTREAGEEEPSKKQRVE